MSQMTAAWAATGEKRASMAAITAGATNQRTKLSTGRTNGLPVGASTFTLSAAPSAHIRRKDRVRRAEPPSGHSENRAACSRCHAAAARPSALLTGDPTSPGLYWELANATRGALVSPSKSWPDTI